MTPLSLNNKRFVATENNQGLSSALTVFHYFQEGEVITGTYSGGEIRQGQIVGKALGDNRIELLFHCLTLSGDLKAGHSTGVISINTSGVLELSFDWEWFGADPTGGKSYYIEVE